MERWKIPIVYMGIASAIAVTGAVGTLVSSDYEYRDKTIEFIVEGNHLTLRNLTGDTFAEFELDNYGNPELVDASDDLGDFSAEYIGDAYLTELVNHKVLKVEPAKAFDNYEIRIIGSYAILTSEDQVLAGWDAEYNLIGRALNVYEIWHILNNTDLPEALRPALEEAFYSKLERMGLDETASMDATMELIPEFPLLEVGKQYNARMVFFEITDDNEGPGYAFVIIENSHGVPKAVITHKYTDVSYLDDLYEGRESNAGIGYVSDISGDPAEYLRDLPENSFYTPQLMEYAETYGGENYDLETQPDYELPLTEIFSAVALGGATLMAIGLKRYWGKFKINKENFSYENEYYWWNRIPEEEVPDRDTVSLESESAKLNSQ